MKTKNTYLVALLILAFSLASFFIGKNFPSRSTNLESPRGQFANQSRSLENGQRFLGNQMRGGQLIGEITAIESDRITIKAPDGSSKIVLIGGETSVFRTIAALPTELKVGSKVAIFGKATADAIISAQNIQIDPQSRIMATPSATPKR